MVRKLCDRTRRSRTPPSGRPPGHRPTHGGYSLLPHATLITLGFRSASSTFRVDDPHAATAPRKTRNGAQTKQLSTTQFVTTFFTIPSARHCGAQQDDALPASHL